MTFIPQESTVISFDGTPLYCTETHPAAAHTVILCDGFGCDGFIWRYLRPALAQQYRVITWHYRGHGRSGPPVQPEALSMAALCADLTAVQDAFKVRRAVLMGHSMGVQLILQAALDAPERVVALVPICGSFGLPLTTLHNTDRASRLFPLLQATVQAYPQLCGWMWRSAMQSRLAVLYAQRWEVNAKALKPTDLAAYFAHLAAMDPQIFVRMLARIQHHTVESRLCEIAAKTLIIAASHDSFTPAHLSRTMQQKIPGAALLEVPGGTHVAPLEFPELIEARLTAFLRDEVFAPTSACCAQGTAPAAQSPGASPGPLQ